MGLQSLDMLDPAGTSRIYSLPLQTATCGLLAPLWTAYRSWASGPSSCRSTSRRRSWLPSKVAHFGSPGVRVHVLCLLEGGEGKWRWRREEEQEV